MAIAPLNATRVSAHGLQFACDHVRIDVVQKHNSLASHFIDAPRTAAGGPDLAIRHGNFQAIVPGDAQDAGRVIAADALGWDRTGVEGHLALW